MQTDRRRVCVYAVRLFALLRGTLHKSKTEILVVWSDMVLNPRTCPAKMKLGMSEPWHMYVDNMCVSDLRQHAGSGVFFQTRTWWIKWVEDKPIPSAGDATELENLRKMLCHAYSCSRVCKLRILIVPWSGVRRPHCDAATDWGLHVRTCVK